MSLLSRLFNNLARTGAQPGPAKTMAVGGGQPAAAPSAPDAAPAAQASSGAKQLLHVGCGAPDPKKLPAFFRSADWREVRLDINPDCKPDIIASMTSMPQVASGAYAAIFSSHNIEHLYPHEVAVALREFHRVLAPDGFAYVTVPDLQQVAELVAQGKLDDTAYVSPAGPIAPHDMLYGHRAELASGNLFMAHRTGFTEKTLANALLGVGFAQVSVRRDGRYALWAIAFRQTQSEEQLKALQQALSAGG